MSTEEPATADAAQPEPPLPGQPFDPSRYLTTISGNRYLEVKWRLLWLRTLHPDAAIETELVRDDGANAVFRARVTLPSGGSATGWGGESYQDFADYIEKAETKSLGRALAALGFGTQFCDDHDGGGRVVDSPVGRGRGGTDDLVTDRQLKAIYAIGTAAGLRADLIDQAAMEAYGRPHQGLTRREASAFIDALKARGAAGTVGDTSATARELAGKPEPKPATARTVAPPIAAQADDVAAERTALNAAMQRHNWTGQDLLAELAPVWPHLKHVADFATLTAAQLKLARGLVSDTHHVAPDGKGRRIVPGPKPPPVEPAGPGADDGLLSVEDLEFDPAPAGA